MCIQYKIMKGERYMATKIRKVGKMSVKIVTDRGRLLDNNIISEHDVEMDNRAAAAVRSAIDKARVCKKPIAKYDPVTQKAYIEYSDGEKKYVN